jgi:molybdopterin-binding protein
MKVSARNLMKGIVKQMTPGAVNAEVTVEIAPNVEITSVITKSSAETLELAEGKPVYVVVKSSDVIIAVD